jgi:DNA polymerase I-like protein with 3'-5' exonuclease and polymerase domains
MMAKAHPSLHPLRELRVSLSQMRLADLSVGSDNRNRTLLSVFQARTGRNQPSNKKFLFGPAVWIRGLIKPELGRGLAYVDWSQQEFGIAAALSKNPNMRRAYLSGDPYLTFVKQAGAIPSTGTKATHGDIREQYKQCALAVQYGMGFEALARLLRIPQVQARFLLQQHQETFFIFWRWSDAVEQQAMLHGHLETVFGWRIQTPQLANPRSLRNFPMQANGAEMLRLACCLATERGILVCAPVHDAILIEAQLDEVEGVVGQVQECMGQASEIVLTGFKLRAEINIIHYPDRYSDKRGQKMWDAVWRVVQQVS